MKMLFFRITAILEAVHGKLVEPRTPLRQACPEFIEGLRANGLDAIFGAMIKLHPLRES